MKKLRFWAFTFLLAQTLFIAVEGHADSDRPSINANGMVRLVYFLPNDRPPRPDRMAAFRQLAKDVQQFYADEMQKHGFGRKTFTVETHNNGEPVVHRIDGKFSEEHYYNSSTDYEVWAELLEHFDNFRHVYFVAIDLSNETLGGGKHCGIGGVSFFSSNRGPWLRNRENPKGQSIGGFAVIPASGACFEKLGLTAHELGHAFGLLHDFREGRSSNYVMAYGSQTHLSKCAAEWLSASHLFNNKSLSRNERGEIQLLELQPHNQDTISLRFKVADSDGLHHAQLVLPEGLLGPILFNCQQLNGKTSTVEFAISVAELVHRITLEVIDAGRITLQIIDLGGTITWERFPIQLVEILSDQKLTALEKISGDNQYSLPFTPLPIPLVVKVIDQNGFAFSGEVAITFTVTAGDGTLSVTRTKTDKNGRAASMLTLGPNLGTNTVEVSAAGIEQTVTFNAVAKAAVDIPDSNLRAAIETTLGVALSNPIALSEMAALTRLEASNANISDLTGLEFASNLTELELGPERVANQWRNSNAVTDLSPLASLTRLTRLHLPNNSISDISALAELTNLTWLNLWGNPISDISPVVGLTNLTDLYLGGNNISDISPLVANTGLGSGDTVNVQYNPLSYQSIHTHIPILRDKGVIVESDNRAHPALLKISGDNQTGASFASLPQPFVVEAQDENGSALVGVSVRFAVTGGGGTLSIKNIMTDENGRAQSTLILGPNLGTNTVQVSATGIRGLAIFHAVADAELPPMRADVNNDGLVNILDLIFIASSFGQSGQNEVDVNGDGVISILDLVLAAGMFDRAAAAPAAQPQAPETLTAVEVQGWLTDARILEVKDAIMKRGLIVLKQLLVSLTPRETKLLANYPNPFNPETWIPYRLAEDAFVMLTIYDLSGQVVRKFEVGHRIASVYESRSKAIHWDGKNGLGEQVASGVYFYTLTAGDYSATRRMVILK